MRRLLSSVLIAASLVSVPSAAFAQSSCLDNLSRQPGRYPPGDLYASATWDRLPQYADQGILRYLVGGWYTENRAAQVNMIQYLYSSFEANGLYRYQDQTCGMPGVPCSQNQGAGSFRAVNNNGRVFVMMNFSDLSRVNQCVSDDVTFPDPTTMIGRNGGVSRKTQ